MANFVKGLNEAYMKERNVTFVEIMTTNHRTI
jgi:hypothetical protein